MHTDGEVRSRRSSAQRLKERMLPNAPPARGNNDVSFMDPSNVAGPYNYDSLSHPRVRKKKHRYYLTTWRRWFSMNTLLAALSISAIIQIIIKIPYVRTKSYTQTILRHREKSMRIVEETGISSFDRKPISLVLDEDFSVEKIRLSWFKIKEKEPKQYDPKSVNYRTNVAGFRHPSYRLNGEKCVAMYDWQESFRPTCNNIHELDIENAPRYDSARMVANGYYRDVWDFKEDVAGNKTSWAIKTLRYDKDFDDWEFLSEQARDATISEQLTFSPNVANIYNYCGLTSMYDFAHNGTLQDHWNNLGHSEKLRISAFISRGLSDLHTLGGGKYPPISHTDIDGRQFIYLNGNFLLNDFNSAGVLLWNEKNKKPCKWTMWRPEDNNRAPEEFVEKTNPTDEKIDVYSLGNTFYKFLTGKRKYYDISQEEATKRIVEGEIATFPEEIEKSNDPVHVALKHAFRRMQIKDLEKRATAKEIADYLEDAWKKYEKEIMNK